MKSWSRNRTLSSIVLLLISTTMGCRWQGCVDQDSIVTEVTEEQRVLEEIIPRSWEHTFDGRAITFTAHPRSERTIVENFHVCKRFLRETVTEAETTFTSTDTTVVALEDLSGEMLFAPIGDTCIFLQFLDEGNQARLSLIDAAHFLGYDGKGEKVLECFTSLMPSTECGATEFTEAEKNYLKLSRMEPDEVHHGYEH